MKRFLLKYWKDLVFLVGYLGGCALLVLAIGPLGFIVAFAVGAIFYVYAGLSPRGAKIAACVVLCPMLFLASLKTYDYAKEYKWPVAEVPDAALERKPKSGAEKRIEEKVDSAVVNIASLSDELDTLKGRIDALSANAKKDRALLNGLMAPPPPHEAEVQPTGPTFEWVPATPEAEKKEEPAEPDWEEVQPKGNRIPNTSPKEPVPDLLVRAQKQDADETPTHVLGTCGRAHKITGWAADGRPIYGPCRDIAGRPACEFVQLGVMNWK